MVSVFYLGLCHLFHGGESVTTKGVRVDHGSEFTPHLNNLRTQIWLIYQSFFFKCYTLSINNFKGTLHTLSHIYKLLWLQIVV